MHLIIYLGQNIPTTSHHSPLGCSGSGAWVKENASPMGISPLLLLEGIIQPLWSTGWGRSAEEQGRERRSWRCLLANKGLCAQTLLLCLSLPGSVCSANTANSPASRRLIQSAKANLASHVPKGLLSPLASPPDVQLSTSPLLLPTSPRSSFPLPPNLGAGEIRLRSTRMEQPPLQPSSPLLPALRNVGKHTWAVLSWDATHAQATGS